MTALTSKISESLSSIQKFEHWTLSNGLSGEYSRLIGDTKFVLKKLQSASKRKPCIGFFGESQVGKSYLVGNLLSQQGEKLMVSHHIEGEPHNFLKKLNPNKQAEATAIVTRFTTDNINNYSGDKFFVELLTPGELLRCLYEGFYLKRSDQYSNSVDETELSILVDTVIKNSGTLVSKRYSDDFCDNYYRVLQRLREVNDEFTLKYAEKVYKYISSSTQLSLQTINNAADLLWYSYEPNKLLFRKLFGLLDSWGEPVAAYLSPNLLSDMLDASYLNKYKFSDAQESRTYIQAVNEDVNGQSSIIIDEARTGYDLALLQILSKEVVFNVLGNHSELLDSFDGIDFPGVKPIGDRETHYSPEEASDKEAAYLIEVIKIGKLKQLFTLHMDNRDITSVLLCTEEGEQNPTQVSNLVTKWVNQSSTWNESNGSDSLITVMTKTDILISADCDEDLATERWNTRFTNHYEDQFEDILLSRRHVGGYKNVFLILNPEAPNYLPVENMGIYKRTFLENAYAQKYVHDLEQNWDALIGGDGGIEYLHSVLCEKYKNREKSYIAGLEKEFIAKVKSISEEITLLIPEEDEQKKRIAAEAELSEVLEALDDSAGDFETLLEAVISWVPEIDTSAFYIEEDAVRRRRNRQNKYETMAISIFDQIESYTKDRLLDAPPKMQSLEASSIKKFALRLIHYGREKGIEPVHEYLELNKLMIEDQAAYLARSVRWLIGGLFYNLWADSFTFPKVNLSDSLEDYFPADEHYLLWKKEVKKLYDLDVQDETSLDTDSLKPLLAELSQQSERD